MTFKSIRAEALSNHNERQHMYAKGGEVHTDEAEDRALIKEMVKPKDLKKGDRRVEGRARGGATDRPGKARTVVNVIVPPAEPAAPVMPPHPPVMAGPPPGPPPQAMPPRPMLPPGQPGMASMGGPPPGGMPPPGMMPRARGGRTERAKGGGLDAGAASGEGRLEKARGGIKGNMIEYGD